MDLSPTIAFKVFVTAAVLAGLLDLHIVRILRKHSPRFGAGRSRSPSPLDVILRPICGRAAYRFVRENTLRFPLVELIAGLLAVLCVGVYGESGAMVRGLLFLGFALPLTMVPWHAKEEATTPDSLTIPGTVIGCASALVPFCVAPHLSVTSLGFAEGGTGWIAVPVGLAHAVAGAFVGYAGLFVIRLVGTAVFKRAPSDVMGQGALKAAMFLGAFFGPRGVLIVVVLGCLLGSILGVWQLIRTGNQSIAFPPYLCMGGVIYLLWGPEVIVFLTEVYPEWIQTIAG